MVLSAADTKLPPPVHTRLVDSSDASSDDSDDSDDSSSSLGRLIQASRRGLLPDDDIRMDADIGHDNDVPDLAVPANAPVVTAPPVDPFISLLQSVGILSVDAHGVTGYDEAGLGRFREAQRQEHARRMAQAAVITIDSDDDDDSARPSSWSADNASPGLATSPPVRAETADEVLLVRQRADHSHRRLLDGVLTAGLLPVPMDVADAFLSSSVVGEPLPMPCPAPSILSLGITERDSTGKARFSLPSEDMTSTADPPPARPPLLDSAARSATAATIPPVMMELEAMARQANGPDTHVTFDDIPSSADEDLSAPRRSTGARTQTPARASRRPVRVAVGPDSESLSHSVIFPRGTVFEKDFGTHGVFTGTVVRYDADALLYVVCYPDGDGEDLTHVELSQFVDRTPRHHESPLAARARLLSATTITTGDSDVPLLTTAGEPGTLLTTTGIFNGDLLSDSAIGTRAWQFDLVVPIDGDTNRVQAVWERAMETRNADYDPWLRFGDIDVDSSHRSPYLADTTTDAASSVPTDLSPVDRRPRQNASESTLQPSITSVAPTLAHVAPSSIAVIDLTTTSSSHTVGFQQPSSSTVPVRPDTAGASFESSHQTALATIRAACQSPIASVSAWGRQEAHRHARSTTAGIPPAFNRTVEAASLQELLASPPQATTSASLGQSRRDATFLAEQAAGNPAALDPEARPARHDLPFHLDTHEDYMASISPPSLPRGQPVPVSTRSGVLLPGTVSPARDFCPSVTSVPVVQALPSAPSQDFLDASATWNSMVRDVLPHADNGLIRDDHNVVQYVDDRLVQRFPPIFSSDGIFDERSGNHHTPIQSQSRGGKAALSPMYLSPPPAYGAHATSLPSAHTASGARAALPPTADVDKLPRAREQDSRYLAAVQSPQTSPPRCYGSEEFQGVLPGGWLASTDFPTLGGLPYVPAVPDKQQSVRPKHGHVPCPMGVTYSQDDVDRASGVLTAADRREHDDMVRSAIFAASAEGWDGVGIPPTLQPGMLHTQQLREIVVRRILSEAKTASDYRRFVTIGMRGDGTQDHLPTSVDRGGEDRSPPRTTSVSLSHSKPAVAGSGSKLVNDLSKLGTFGGGDAEWPLFQKSIERVAGVNNLEHVLEPGYLQSPSFDYNDNKLLYFLLQKAVMDSTVAFAHFEKAAKFDGHGAYFHLHNAYTMAGSARSVVLLQELTLFRLDSGERLAVFCARLQKLFADLSGLSGENKMVFSDVQKLNYLLTAIRHEPDLQEAYVNLQSKQVSGEMDFTTAIHTLERRCEAMRADQALIDGQGGGGRRQGFVATAELVPSPPTLFPPSALITTMNKRLSTAVQDGTPCLVEGCPTPCFMPICQLHYAEMVCGKKRSLSLKNGWGNVTYDATGRRAIFPVTVPVAATKRHRPDRTYGQGGTTPRTLVPGDRGYRDQLYGKSSSGGRQRGAGRGKGGRRQ